jgi:hypothetical protein
MLISFHLAHPSAAAVGASLVVSPVPVRVARESGADLVIAVDVSRQLAEHKELDSSAAMLRQAFIVMEHALAQEEIQLADVVIRPNLANVRIIPPWRPRKSRPSPTSPSLRR